MTIPAADQDRWIRRFHRSAATNVRLFCFPHAGGAASYYFPFSSALAPRVEVQAIQYPGRQDRRAERCIENIPDLADFIYDALRRSLGDRPYAFFGHSMGAVVAYEVARRLRQRTGEGPCRLFVSGRRAPSRRRNDGIHLRGDAGIVAELRRVGGTDTRWLDDDELLATILPTIRSDYRAIETYEHVPGPPLDCPITALVGDADSHVTVEDARAWQDHSTGEFDLRVFSGGHFYLDAHRGAVVETIATALGGMSQVEFSSGSVA